MLDWNSIVCFCEVAQSGNFTQSAEKFDMSVATLTRKINSLEKQLGTELFYRNTRKIALTEEGNHFYRRVQDKVSSLQDELIWHQEEKLLINRKIKIASLPELAEVYLIPVLAEIAANAPDIQVELVLSPDLVDVDFDDIDFALRAGEPDKEGIKVCKLGTETLTAFRHQKYQDNECLALATYDDTFIYEKRSPSAIVPSMQILKTLAEHHPYEVYLSERWLTATMHNRDSELVMNRELQPYNYDIYIAYGAKRALKPAARTFLDILKNHAFEK